ncbi:MAG TPA: carbohydrate-binding family 9-like protein [Vicinamibacterales bacterium]
MLAFLSLLALLASADTAVFESTYVPRDFELTADPGTREWTDAPRVTIDRDYLGRPIPGRPTEVRSRWTDTHLYLLYVCPFDTLNLKPDPATDRETPRLWNWDVAEAFIGSDFERITRYKEFQVSPQGEWIDLDIDRSDPKGQVGAAWDSSFAVRARIDADAKVWYGEMRIPFSALGATARPGTELRIGLYRIANVEPRTYYAWRPTGKTSFHVPEAFGTLRLQKGAGK